MVVYSSMSSSLKELGPVCTDNKEPGNNREQANVQAVLIAISFIHPYVNESECIYIVSCTMMHLWRLYNTKSDLCCTDLSSLAFSENRRWHFLRSPYSPSMSRRLLSRCETETELHWAAGARPAAEAAAGYAAPAAVTGSNPSSAPPFSPFGAARKRTFLKPLIVHVASTAV